MGAVMGDEGREMVMEGGGGSRVAATVLERGKGCDGERIVGIKNRGGQSGN